MNTKLIVAGMTLCMALAPAGKALADAPPTDFTCGPIKDNALTAISPYTKKVLERAEKGLVYAREAGAATDFLSIMPGWMLSLVSAWSGLTDTSTQRTDAIEELNNVSACLHFDLTLIDCKIEDVRQEIRTQSARGSFVALIRLTTLLQFLNDRRQQLAIGALDPQYPDPTWGYHYAFDRPALIWCTSETTEHTCVRKEYDACTAEQDAQAYESLDACEKKSVPPINPPQDSGRLCPFNADYAPAFDNGFGCDIGAMEPRKIYPPIYAELEGLKAVSGALAQYRKTAVEVQKLQKEMNELFKAQSSSSSSSQSSREHLKAFGCGWMGGWCSDDPKKRCTSKADCKDMKATCDFSDKVCKQNRAIRCTKSDQCGEDGKDGPCIEAEEPVLRSIRGNFSLDRDQMSILTTFLGTRSQQEISRVFREDLQTAAELPEADQAAREKRAKEDADPVSAIFRLSIRMAVQAWSRTQARNEGLMYPEAIDAPLETAHALQDLHINIAKIARIAKEKTGLRAFVTNYASFLRRSCIYRPCSLLLDQAIRLSTTDECFPYTNGEYLDDDAENPRWEKCKKGAGIE